MEQNDDRYFKEDEYPSKILCFFITNRKPDLYSIVQSCIGRDIEQDSIVLQQWEKECVRHCIKVMH